MTDHPSIAQRAAKRSATRRRILVSAAAVSLCAGLVAVNVAQSRPAAAAPGLSAFEDCEDVAQWHQANDEAFAGAGGWQSVFTERLPRGRSLVAADAPAGDVAAAAGATNESVGSSATGTNIQEAGVDEPDTLKTDGSHLFTIEADRLVLTQVDGDEPVKRGEVQLPWLREETSPEGLPLGARMASELLLAGDRVVIMSTGLLAADHLTTHTQLAVVDVADPTSPRILSSQRVTGRYLSARLHDGRIRLAVATTPNPGFVAPGGARAFEDAEAHNRDAWANATGDDFLPTVTSADGRATPLLECAEVRHPVDYAGSDTLSVLTIDPQATEPIVDALGVTASGGTVYASEDRLYVAASGPWGAVGDIAPEWGGWRSDTTSLHGFDISDPDDTTYLASGEVRGWLLNQWAMSARDGYLRVATTRPPQRPAPTATAQPAQTDSAEPGEPREVEPGAVAQVQQDSAVTVFREAPAGGGKPGHLEAVGEVAGLGKTETIRAVRWFEDTAVVVTFRQTDPLYLIDLSDPTSPRMTGELKIPGYSAYLHPVGGGMLLGVGHDANERGRVLGAQVSTFDVSDLSRPRQLHVLTEADSRAAVEGDSRVFAYVPSRRVAIVQVWSQGGAALRAVRVESDGQLAQVGSYTGGEGETPDAPGENGLAPPSQQVAVERTIPVSANRLATVVRDRRTGAGSVVLLWLDELAASSLSAL